MKKQELEGAGDCLESKTKKELIEILRSYINYETPKGTILNCPLYAIYLVHKFFGSLMVIREIIKK